jgi:dinuclear metal center YbgI/SA1388 family protein
MSSRIKDIANYLEGIAPRSMQESYDNSGLLVGNPNVAVSGILVSLDCTPEVVNEAISKGCNLIVSHHPVIFKGLKKITGATYSERTIIEAIRHGVALYAIHTNLDNFDGGVNHEIGLRLGLFNLKVLRPKADVLNKLTVFVPSDHADRLVSAMYAAGAGKIGNYEECSFSVEGTGTYKPVGQAEPFQGVLNERSTVSELRVEFLVSSHRLSGVIHAMKDNHPYEEVAYDIIPLRNLNQNEGSGMIGELGVDITEAEFLTLLKKTFNSGCIRHTSILGRNVRKVAFCGGAGSFLLSDAIAAGADFFVTGDFKYHEFFDAEHKIVIADIGHYESEQFTVNQLAGFLKKNFTTFAVHLTETNTNPINYF